MRRLPTRRLFMGAAILIAAGAVFLWAVPSSDYLYLPNEAKPLAGKVRVEGGKDPADGGIYYVDLTIRKASWLERLFPFLRPDGATIAPQAAVVPEGSTFEARREAGREAMARSEEVAAAVALRAAGLKVQATPRGALVEGIARDVPAAGALEEGDVIVAVDGNPVRTPGELRNLLASVRPTSEVRLTFRRDGRRSEATVRTVRDPRDPNRAVIGIQVAQAADIRLPLNVDIDLGDVGGPSAGLPFALEILEELGRNVARSCRVAATGELELDGSVRPVGGLKQKTFGVRRAGADVFLVPAGDNAVDARRYADGMAVIPVKSFQQALRALRTDAEKC